MAPWRPASAASPYRHAVSPARSHVYTEPSDPYRLSESATRTSNDAYGDYHEIEQIMRRERQENDRMQAQKAELKEAERRAFVAERRAESAERAAAERAREAEAEVAVAEEVATQAVVANRDARRALEAARAEVEGYRQTLSEMGTPPASPLSARSLRASPHASPHRPDDAAIPVRAPPQAFPPHQPASPVQPAKIAELVNALARADAKAERHRVIADGLRVDLDAAAAALDVERRARLAAEAASAAHEQKRMDAVERLLRRAKDGAALRSDVATPTRASQDLIAGALTPNDSHDVASAAAGADTALTRAEEDLVALEREHAIELDHLRTQIMKSKAETDATQRALDAARAAEEAAVLERDAATMAGAVAERDLALLERGRVGREGPRRAQTGPGGTGRHRATVRGDIRGGRVRDRPEPSHVRGRRGDARSIRTMARNTRVVGRGRRRGRRSRTSKWFSRRRPGGGANVARGQGRAAGGVAPHPRGDASAQARGADAGRAAGEGGVGGGEGQGDGEHVPVPRLAPVLRFRQGIRRR